MSANDPIDAKYHLAVRDEAPPPQLFSAMSPAAKLALGKEVATVLKGMLREGKIVIDENGNEKRVPLIIRVPQKRDGRIVGYSEHVEVEGWLTCGMLAGSVTAPVRWTKPLEDGNGFSAFAEVVSNGQVIGAGEGHCDRNERKWKNADNYAIKSMAQTRAQSKALRSVFAWIMVLAGFAATPANEMPDETEAPRRRREPPPKPQVVQPEGRKPDEYRRKAGIGEVHKLCERRHVDDPTYREWLVEKFGVDKFVDKETGEVKPTSKVLDVGELEQLWLFINERTK